MYETDKMAKNARLNWAENMLLSHEHARSKSQLAVVACIEPDVKNGEKDGFIRSLTFDELYLEVAQLASALKKLGVKSGDRVAALIPNNAGT
jgi:acetoacetyl-CoA synthetase